MRTSSDLKPNAVYWKLFVSMAVTSILSWRLIAREMVVIAIKVALLAANVAVIIYVVGFAFHGGRLSVNGGSSDSRPPANV